MDMIFQNFTDITDEVLHESSKNYNVYNKNLRITILLASLISVFYIIVGLNKKLYSVCLVELIMALFFLLIFFNGYILKAKQNYKNMQALYEKQPQSIFTFFADNFEFVAADIKSRADYNQVTKMIETQNLYMLIIEKQMLILNKNSFTVGDAKAFIFEKCKRIYINKKLHSAAVVAAQIVIKTGRLPRECGIIGLRGRQLQSTVGGVADCLLGLKPV